MFDAFFLKKCNLKGWNSKHIILTSVIVLYQALKSIHGYRRFRTCTWQESHRTSQYRQLIKNYIKDMNTISLEKKKKKEGIMGEIAQCLVTLGLFCFVLFCFDLFCSLRSKSSQDTANRLRTLVLEWLREVDDVQSHSKT